MKSFILFKFGLILIQSMRFQANAEHPSTLTAIDLTFLLKSWISSLFALSEAQWNCRGVQQFRARMLVAYDHLKQLLVKQGYEHALSFVEGLGAGSAEEEMVKTNFYCYLTIQRGFKVHQSLTILQGCLAQPCCRGALRALTRYHICQIHFIEDLRACGQECEEMIAEFIGAYHMLREHLERTAGEEQELAMLQYVIYYCLLLLGYLRGREGRTQESENYIAASNNLLRTHGNTELFVRASNGRTRSAENKERMQNVTY